MTNGAIQLTREGGYSAPHEAWDDHLGSRSALDWIVDRCNEKTPKDPAICEKVDIYNIADNKAHVIDLLMRVTR